jgi:hypothetical protein
MTWPTTTGISIVCDTALLVSTGKEERGQARRQARIGPEVREVTQEMGAARFGAEGSGSVRIGTPCDGICRLRVSGVLDAHAGARVVRCVDARLQLAEAGYHPTRHLLVDLTDTTDATHAGLRALPRAQYTAHRRGIDLHLIGADHLTPTLPPVARAPLRALAGFPDLPAALAALHSYCQRCTST